MLTMCAGVLGLESIALFLTAPVLVSLTDVGATRGWGTGIGLALLCVLGAALMRRGIGLWIGHLVQVLAIALGLVIPVMFVLGGMFAVLWILALVLGRRVDEAKAMRAAAEEPPG
jgi:hypothetical protein